jgi:nitrogen fixation NifU-like protein
MEQLQHQEYIDLILDHYENPHNRGAVENASVVMKGGNPGCGDIVTLYVTIDPTSERISDIHFEGEGCTISQAGASMITGMVGKTIPEIEELGYEVVIDMMGREVVATRLRCATLGLSTLKSAVKKYKGTLLRVLPNEGS